MRFNPRALYASFRQSLIPGSKILRSAIPGSAIPGSGILESAILESGILESVILKSFIRIASVVLAIGALTLSHPERGGWLAPGLSWIGLSLLLSAVRGLNPWKSALVATVALTVSFRFWLEWMALSPYLDPLSEVAALATALVLALSMGLWVGLLTRLDLTRSSMRLWAALTCCLLEWSRQFWLCGFPWYPLGVSWLESSSAIYAWLGPVGSSLPIVWASLEMVYAQSWKRRCLGVGALALGCAALMSWSLSIERRIPLQVALVHSELPVHHFHTSLDSDQIARALMTRLPDIPPRPRAYRILLTPEGLFPDSGSYFHLLEREGLRQLSPAWLARAYGGYLFMGVEDDCTRRGWVTNSLWVFSPAGTRCMAYAKRKLIPFAEYFPLAHWPLLGEYVQDLSRSYGILDALQAGEELGLFDLPASSLVNGEPESPLRLALTICFEETFPSHILDLRQGGAQLWLSSSNDGWYPRSELAREHAIHARMVSAALGMPLLRSTQLGITGVIDGRGRWIRSSIDEKSGAISWLCFDGDLEVLKTPFSRVGDAAILIPWSLLLLCFGIRPLRRIGWPC